MLQQFKITPVAIMRLATVSGNRKALATTQTALCQHQNIDTRQQHVSEGIASKTYSEWFDPDMDIQEGDVIRNKTNNQTYKVIGVERKGQGLGLIAEHLEVILVKYNF
jgi:hypothetical protein